MRNQPNPILIYGAGLLGIYFLVLKPILENLNLMDTREEKDAEQLKEQTETSQFSKDYWNPNYIKQAGTDYYIKLFPEADMRIYSKRLWDAHGTVNDDEEAIYAVFRAMKYKTQVSFLTYWFNKLYGKDLYTWLRDSVLNKEELNTVLTITSKLPTGFVKK